MVRARPAVEHHDRGPVANPPLEELQPELPFGKVAGLDRTTSSDRVQALHAM